MCIYKVWQHGFKTQHTLHIVYDESRSHLCDKCNYCVKQCFLELDPRKTEIYDSCINCGECITACNNLQSKNQLPGLWRFKVGEDTATKLSLVKARLSSLSSRVQWTIPFAMLGLSMFIWGVVSYERYHLAVYRADIIQGAQISDYRVAVSNKLYDPSSLDIEIEGLDPSEYQLNHMKAEFDTVGRVDLKLHIKGGLPAGLHSFIVHAKSNDGWKDSYRVQHFVASN